ncbi:MAG: class B sortase [Christensenellales bacterium]
MRWDKFFARAARRVYIALRALQIRALNMLFIALRYFSRVHNRIINMKGKGRGTSREHGRMHTAIHKIKRGIIKKAKGNTALVAKIAVSAFSVVMGLLTLMLCVYVIIPSIISNAAHYFEHDFAIQLYNRTLKQNEIAAFGGAANDRQIVFPRDCFGSVLKQNPDIVGRLSISALNLGYLVTQHTDNTYYLHTGYNLKPGKCGAIFLDCTCNAGLHPPGGHYILYGKDMQNGTMFGNLRRYKDADFFKTGGTLRFDTLYGDYEWQVFSAYETQSEQNFEGSFLSGEEWLCYLKRLAAKSLHPKDINLSPDDALLTLCTDGTANNTRFVVHAVLIK